MLRREIIHKDLSYKTNGLLFETQNSLGRYRKEKEYCDYFEELLKRENINYKRELRINIKVNEADLKCRNICDFIIDGKIILEFKINFLNKDSYLQIKRYLSATNLKLGILINFRQKSLIPKRIINNEIK